MILFWQNLENHTAVLLKNLNWQSERNHFVRPGQHLGVEKFQSRDHRIVYCFIKALKKILSVDVSMYMVKKMMLTEQNHLNGHNHYIAFFNIMSEPELKEKFVTKINYDLWKEVEMKVYIPLKKQQ
jgi:hypothetical protein